MNEIEVAVIGGGVVGLACALKLAESGAEVCVIERESRPGRGMSTHNSGVIHAGIYYPARFAQGRPCASRVANACTRFASSTASHISGAANCSLRARRGKSSELETLRARGTANGVSLELVDARFIHRREPHVRAVAALWSPDTGIIEAEALITTLGRLCRDLDVAMLVGTPITGAAAVDGGIELVTPHERFRARTVVNAAGLYADDISAMLGGRTISHQPMPRRVRRAGAGKRGWVNGLVYPLPNADGSGLGVHLTRTTWGSVLVGPTANFQHSKEDYEGDRLPLEAFLEPARTLLPEITLADLQPGGTGIRAKLHGPHETFADFLIERDLAKPARHSGRRNRIAWPHIMPRDWRIGRRDSWQVERLVLQLVELHRAHAIEQILEQLSVCRNHVGDKADQQNLKSHDHQHRSQQQRLQVTGPVVVEIEVQEPERYGQPGRERRSPIVVNTLNGSYIV